MTCEVAPILKISASIGRASAGLKLPSGRARSRSVGFSHFPYLLTKPQVCGIPAFRLTALTCRARQPSRQPREQRRGSAIFSLVGG